MRHPNDSFQYWSTFSQYLFNTVEKVYNTSKWTCFYIQFVHPNYIFFTSDEKHELVVFLIFWDKVCLWNGCYVNISRIVLILEWIAHRFASVYRIKRSNVGMCMRVCVSQNSNGILKVIWIYAFTECLWACNLVWVKISFDLHFKSVANIPPFSYRAPPPLS